LLIEGLGRIVFCHATVRSDEELFTPITPAERLQVIFSGVEQDYVICGHSHLQFERRLGDLHIVNAGSVGMPYADRPGAYWLLLSPDGFTFRWTGYDTAQAAREMRASGHPLAQEFTAENVLTVPSVAEATEALERSAEKRWRQGE
jgi:hypothetical protein